MAGITVIAVGQGFVVEVDAADRNLWKTTKHLECRMCPNHSRAAAGWCGVVRRLEYYTRGEHRRLRRRIEGEGHRWVCPEGRCDGG